MNLLRIMLGFALAALTAASTLAQTNPADTKPADIKPADTKPVDPKLGSPLPSDRPRDRGPEFYRTFYLKNVGDSNDLNDLQTAMRNMFTGVKMYAEPSQKVIVMRGSAEELTAAQKMITELDLPKKLYRLTYTITESDDGKRIGVQHFAMVVASGEKTNLKQGSKVPLMIGASGSGASDHSSQVEYEDVGLEIKAQVDVYGDGVRLRSIVEQSSLAEEKSGVGAQDPVIRQTTLEGTSTLVLGKPLVLGSLDIPGSTRHQEVEVVAELIR